MILRHGFIVLTSYPYAPPAKKFQVLLVTSKKCISDVQSKNKEVESGTDATISCVVTGITKKLDDIVWRRGGVDVKTLSESDYVVSEGIYNSNSQTTTLTVKAASNTADSSFTCELTSNEWLVTNRQTNVILNVFSKFLKRNL
jgi:hypothetical protein